MGPSLWTVSLQHISILCCSVGAISNTALIFHLMRALQILSRPGIRIQQAIMHIVMSLSEQRRFC